MNMHASQLSLSGQTAEMGQHLVFDAFTEDAAAQQKRVHSDGGLFRFQDDRPD
jgi:hypothetical protein